jgi:hypothetical protein
MNELLSDNLWAVIKQLGKKASARRAAVAYVTSEEFVKFSEGDVLVTDASDHAIAMGQTDAQVLANAFKRGAQLYSIPGLHTKVLLLGGSAVIGSANLSDASATNLVEAAWVTDAPAAVGMATSLVQQLTNQAQKIDEGFLKRILKIEVKAHPKPADRAAKPKKVKIPKHASWIIGIDELVKDFPAEQAAIESGSATAEGKLTKSSSPGPVAYAHVDSLPQVPGRPRGHQGRPGQDEEGKIPVSNRGPVPLARLGSQRRWD